MSENIGSTHNIAVRINDMRNVERNGFNMLTSRDGRDYLDECNGLQHYFNYVKSLNPNGTVLDIGAGTTHGCADLAHWNTAKGLRFEATVLRRDPRINEYLGFRSTHITSAEALRGFKPESISAVLSVYGLAYADLQAVVRINEVLIPGGIIKATFGIKDMARDDGTFLYGSGQYVRKLRELGYDVDVITPTKPVEHAVLVAVKPGGRIQKSAHDILYGDRDSFDIQKTEIMKVIDKLWRTRDRGKILQVKAHSPKALATGSK